MALHRSRRRAFALLALLLMPAAVAGEIYSTMRNVNAVAEARGFLLSTADDIAPTPLASDLAPPQAFEIIRAGDQPVTIGRLFTSCSCIQIESPKRTFAAGERAIMILRNIRPTPHDGQVYAVFVQITSPIRATLRIDTFVQSGSDPIPPLSSASRADGNNLPAVADHPPFGSRQGSPAVLLDEELERLGETGNVTEDDSEVIRELSQAAEESSLGELPRLAAIPPVVQRTPETEAVLGHAEASGPDMTPRLDGDELEGYLAGSAAPEAAAPALPLDIPDGDDVRDSLGDVRGDLEDLYSRDAGNPDVAADVDAARQAMDSYRRGDSADDNLGTADLAVAVDIDSDIPDFYAHMPATPVPPAEAAAVPLPAAAPAVEPAVNAAAPAAPAALQRDPTSPKPVQAISLITVGTRDMPRAIRFYEALGWQRAAASKYDQTAFFQLQGQILALYPMNDQLREQNMPDALPSPGGITLALHVQDKADVYAVFQRFVDAGGTALRSPAEMPSGAVTSYVADPDGNPWEISCVPQFRIDENGGLWLP